MFWIDAVDGVQAILPPKTRGRGANTFDSSEVTDHESGTVVKAGTGTVTIGYLDSVSESATFHAYTDGLMDGDDAFVRHGKGCRLAVSVSGHAGLRIGYSGAAK